MIIPVPLAIIMLSATDMTQIRAEKKKGIAQGRICTSVWRTRMIVRPGRTVTIKLTSARNRIPITQGFLKLNCTPPIRKYVSCKKNIAVASII